MSFPGSRVPTDWSVHRSVKSETEFTLQGCCEIRQTTWLFGFAILSRSCRTTRCPIWVLANNRRAMLRATFTLWNEREESSDGPRKFQLAIENGPEHCPGSCSLGYRSP